MTRTLEHEAVHDRPIGSSGADLLDRGPFVESLIRALIRPEIVEDGRIVGRQATGYAVGLTGAWGLGKTSILQLVANELEEIPFVAVARFNPWLFKGRDELVVAFFNALRQALGKSAGEYGRDLIGAVDTYWDAINTAGTAAAGVADLHGAAGTASGGWRLLSKIRPKNKPQARTPEEERRSLEKKLKSRQLAVVVLIDELDRVEDDEVRAVAQLVKAVGDIAGVSYLVAYDPERVVDALGRGATAEDRRESGERYLEKIIQHAIPLRPLFREDVDALIMGALTDHGLNPIAGNTEAKRKILDFILDAITTPREVKRLIGTYAVLEAAVRGELDAVDVLAYSWITVKSPNLRALIARHPDKLVSDPPTSEMINRLRSRRNDREAPPTPVDVLGDVARSHSDLLTLLFARFERHREAPEGDRISYRRNLIRLLYLGNPPSMLPRTTVEALWQSDDADYVTRQLRSLIKQGRARDLIGRIADLLPQISDGNHLMFWTGLADAVLREEDWADGPNDLRALIDDAEQLMSIFGQYHRESAKIAIDGLIKSGDLSIIPGVLRKHLYAHGLTRHDGARGGEVIFTKDETEALFASELPRYKDAIFSGFALRRVADVEVWFVISNRGEWDEELRTSMTAQLSTSNSIATAASLLTPQGWSIDFDVVDKLFDTQAVKERLLAFDEAGEMPTDEWIANAVSRFRRRLVAPRVTAGELA